MSQLYERGSIVLVPFLFTDLSQSKQRPAVVILPSNFSSDNIIVCAVASRTSSVPKPWEVTLNPEELEINAFPSRALLK